MVNCGDRQLVRSLDVISVRAESKEPEELALHVIEAAVLRTEAEIGDRDGVGVFWEDFFRGREWFGDLAGDDEQESWFERDEDLTAPRDKEGKVQEVSEAPQGCEIFVGPHKFVVVRRFDFDKDRNVLSVHIAHKEVVRSSYRWFVLAAASVLNRVDRGALSEPGHEGLEFVLRVHASVDAPNAFSEQIEVDGGKVFAKVVDIVKGGERQPLQLRGCVSGRCVAWVPCWHADLTSFRCAVMAELADVVDDLKSLATFDMASLQSIQMRAMANSAMRQANWTRFTMVTWPCSSSTATKGYGFRSSSFCCLQFIPVWDI